jgi:hypothetical protein
MEGNTWGNPPRVTLTTGMLVGVQKRVEEREGHGEGGGQRSKRWDLDSPRMRAGIISLLQLQ